MDSDKVVKILEEIRDGQQEHHRSYQEYLKRYEATQVKATSAARIILLVVLLIVAIMLLLPLLKGLTCKRPKTIANTATYYKPFSEESGLKVISHQLRQSKEGSLSILGTISNTGSDTWNAIQIEVDFFDDKDNFVDRCVGYISTAINPSKNSHFKVACIDLVPAFKRYEVKIAEALYQANSSEVNPR